MIKLTQAIVVEGRYDRMKLSAIFDAPIVETGGFNLFHSEPTQALIRHFANTVGIVLLTDSDPALTRTATGFTVEREDRDPFVYEGDIRELALLRDGYILEVFLNGGEEIFTIVL